MSQIDAKLARYLAAASGAVETGQVDPKYLTADCTECGDEIGFDDGMHIFLTLETPDPSGNQVVLLVGCEGYLFIPPASIGLAAKYPNWQDWTSSTAVVDIDVAVSPDETLERVLEDMTEGFEVTAMFLPGERSGNGHPVMRVAGAREEVAKMLLKHDYPLSEYGLGRDESAV